MTARDFAKIPDNVKIEGIRAEGDKEYIHIGTREVAIDKDYTPMGDSPKDYMSEKQLVFFKKVLLNWKHDLIEKTKETISALSEDAEERRVSEEGDFAVEEERILTELRTRDRYRKLIHKIEAALIKIETGEYGYCEESGEEIGIPRLMIRPIATLAIEKQQQHEQEEDTREDSEYAHQLLASNENQNDQTSI